MIESLRSEAEIRENLRQIALHNIARGTTWAAKWIVFVDWWKRW